MIPPTLDDVHREYFGAYAALDPQAIAAIDLLESGVSFNRVAALYPLDLHRLSHHFAAIVSSEAQLPKFLELMKDRGLGLIHNRASNEVLDQFFLMPDLLDFAHPQFQKLSATTADESASLNLMTNNQLGDALTAIANALWLGFCWAQLSETQDLLVGVVLVKVLRSYREALQTLDSSQVIAVS